MFSDSDSLGVNNRIAYEIFNDTLDMLKPDCKAYEADHQGLKASAINCSKFVYLKIKYDMRINRKKLYFKLKTLLSELIFSRSGILRKSPYCIELTASDPTVEILHSRAYKMVYTTTILKLDFASRIHIIYNYIFSSTIRHQ